MKPKHFYIFLLTAGIIYLTITAFSFQTEAKDPSNAKLIKFTHQTHIENELDCENCHTDAAESISLSDKLLPTMEACGECHDVEDDENCELCHFEEVLEPLPVSESPIYFSHKSHIEEQEMECTSCHQGLEKVDYGFESATLFPSMGDCYQCHDNTSKATNVCEQCHVSTADLVPLNHKQVNFNKDHKFSSLEADADCAMCHDNNFCESCHVGTIMIDETNAPDNFLTPYSPHRLVDNTNQQQISLVHDLNYRYNHGIDARGKASECATCHQTETFCAECHNVDENGDFAMEGFVPTSHTQPNFTTMGVGSGGGVHAEIARRDIETCASCHDTQGADPNCIMCHTDNDGIKGTNPKTHVVGFMNNEHGDWHGDFGAVCYNCHTDGGALSQTQGQGFCGYCHN
ncbi:MAG: cytochrome c3 family protein [Bacteroidota bacterium]